MCNQKFFVCKHCGNLVGIIKDSGVPLICCGEAMTELVANTVDASKEKHVPVVEIHNGKVNVKIGAAEHPMVEEHFIEWIYLQTKNSGQRKCLKPGDKPEATFLIDNETPIAVYAYCNIHGLWKSDI